MITCSPGSLSPLHHRPEGFFIFNTVRHQLLKIVSPDTNKKFHHQTPDIVRAVDGCSRIPTGIIKVDIDPLGYGVPGIPRGNQLVYAIFAIAFRFPLRQGP